MTAQFRFMPAANAFSSVMPIGSGLRHPDKHEWVGANEGSVNGDIIKIDLSAFQSPAPGYQVDYYEVAIEERGQPVRYERILYGPAIGKERRFYTNTATTEQRVRIRTVQRKLDQIKWSGTYTPQVGDAVAQTSTGVTADVKTVNSIWMIVENINGVFDPGEPITIAGNAGTLTSNLHVPHRPDDRTEIKGEWSAPMFITPTVGTPTAIINASKTTCLQGESVVLIASQTGLQCERPLHDLHYRFSCAKAGEQGSFSELSASYFENEFGASQNNRAEGYSAIWAFAPQTTGTVTVDLTVRDRSGNSATISIDLTVEAPTDAFSDVDVYAVSATSRAVPGAPAANIYTDFETLYAAVPATGEALVLLDTTGSHGATSFNQYNFSGKCPDRFAVMSYSDAGTGVAAGARAHIDYCFRSNSRTAVLQGCDIIGPYDPTDPNSITSRPQEAWHVEDVTEHASVDSCKLNGWNKSIVPSLTGTFMGMTNIEMTDYLDFGIHGGDLGTHALSGCYGWHNPEGWHYNDAKQDAAPPLGEGFFVDHPSYRASRPRGDRGMSKCVFFAAQSWGGPVISQPAIRSFGNADTGHPYLYHLTECIFEARASVEFGCTANGGFYNFDAPQDICLDKFVILAAGQPGAALVVSVAPFTARNGRIVYPDKDGVISGSGAGNFFTTQKSGASNNAYQNDVENQPVVFENMTCVALQADNQPNTSSISKIHKNGGDFTFSSVTIRNTLHYAPNLTSSAAAISTNVEPVSATPRYTPLFKGDYNWDDTVAEPKLSNQTIDLTTATPNSITATFEPASGSNAYQTAASDIPYDDIQSRVRPTNGTASKGASDPGGSQA